MKTHPLLPLLAFCLCTCPSPVWAEGGQGLSQKEMTNLYGEDFAKEAADAQKLIDEEWDADTIDEDAAEEETPAPKAQEKPAPAEPQPAVAKKDDKAAAQEAALAKAAEEEAAQEAAQAKAAEEDAALAKAAAKARALRKKMLESTVSLVKAIQFTIWE